MEDKDYTIENLSLVFCEHALKNEKYQQDLINQFKKEYPNEKLPESLLDTFNICRALSIMAFEIEKLKIRCN